MDDLNSRSSCNPFAIVIKHQKASVLAALMLSATLAVSVYIFAVFIPSTLSSLLPHDDAMLLCSTAFFLTFICSVFVGACSDKVGAVNVFRLSCLGFIILAYPLIKLLLMKTFLSALLSELIMVILVGSAAGSLIPLLIVLFPKHLRYTGVGLGFNLSMTVFGSTAPMVFLYLTHTDYSIHLLSGYLMLISSVAMLTSRGLDQSNNELRNEGTSPLELNYGS